MPSQTPDPENPTVERTSVLADDPTAPRAAAEHRWQALAALMAVRSPSLAPLVRVAPLTDGVSLTHRLPAGAVTLEEVRSTGPLRAGHVLTVALAVAAALVELAENDLAHGGIRADQVLVATDGTVVLGGAGLAWRRPPTDIEGPRVRDDVAALGDLVRDLLGHGSAPSPLVLAALRASDSDPLLRPAPADLYAMLERCGRADPLLPLLWRGPSAEAVPTPGPPGAWPPDAWPADAGVPPALRIDPRTAPYRADAGGYEQPRHDEQELAEIGQREHAEPPEPGEQRPPRSRRSGSPPRPGAAGRRPARQRRVVGPLTLALVAVLALLTLGAVRVGARALADGPSGAAAAPSGASSPAAADGPTAASGTGSPTPAPSATGQGATGQGATAPSRAPSGAVGAPATVPTSAATDATTAGPAAPDAAGEAAGLVLDRGATSSAPDWSALLAAVDAGRQQAISGGSVAALRDWVDPAGTSWAADSALASRVSALHARIVGGALVALDIRPRSVAAARAVLLVRDRRESYSVTSAGGTATVADRSARWWRVTLVREETLTTGAQGWRVHDVAPASAPAP